MKPSKLVLLPGLDGTGAMFAPFIHALPKDVLAEPVVYPESLESFDEYVEFAAAALHGTADVVVIAESFSGPIAISLLRKPPPNLRAIVLVATFTTAPRALLRRLSKLVPSAVIRAFVPAALNWFCANRNTASEVLRIANDVVSRVPIETLDSRLRLLGELLKQPHDGFVARRFERQQRVEYDRPIRTYSTIGQLQHACLYKPA